ncbi:MAG: preprotein translocase subunit SecE [Clostridia bacterium]|nr:preprotein translocase subunit SecE [Clostridia bacterium]
MANGFLKGIKSELKKVVWPTKNQLINNTLLVVVLVVILSAVVLSFDLILELIDSSLWNFISSKIG